MGETLIAAHRLLEALGSAAASGLWRTTGLIAVAVRSCRLMRMEFEAEGVFWVDDDNDPIRGRLSFTSADGGDLRLDRPFAGPGGKAPQELDVAYGRTLDRTPLCLMGLFTNALVIPGLPRAVGYFANQVLVGLDNPGEPIDRVRVGLRRMHDFTGRSALWADGELGDPGQPISVAWTPPDRQLTATVDDLQVRLVTERDVARDTHRVVLEEKAEFELSSDLSRPMGDWYQPSAFLDLFVAFLLDFAPSIERLYAPRERADANYLFLQLEPPEPSRRPWLTVGQIADRFEPALNGWFRFARGNEAAYHVLNEYLLRAASFGEGGSLELQDRLLYLARFVETYHRGAGRYQQSAPAGAGQQRKIDEVVDAAPAEHREWLRQRLSRGSRKSLRERIVELVLSFGDAVAPVVGASVDGFARQVADNRNYWTHYTEHYRDKGRVLEALDLSILVARLWLLVRACVLREMGFDNDAVRGLLRRASNYHTLVARGRAEATGSTEGAPDS